MPPTHQRFKDLKDLRTSVGRRLSKVSEVSELSALSVLLGRFAPGQIGSWADWLLGSWASTGASNAMSSWVVNKYR